MNNRRWYLSFSSMLLLVLTLALVAPAITSADVGFPDDREIFGLGLQLSYRNWTIDDEVADDQVVVRQFATRLKGTVDVTKMIDLVVYTAGGFSQDRRETVSEISGLADTKLKAYGYAWNDQLLLGLGVNLPTGITALDDEEVRAVQSVSTNVLGFRMKDYGRGTDVDLSASLGFDVGRGWTVGGGLSYLVRGEYDLDTRTSYAPGNEFAATAGADWRNDQWLFSLDSLYRNFGQDTVSGDGTFADGDQLETTARVTWRPSKWGGHFSLRHIFKQDSEYHWDLPASDTRVDNGNNIWLTLTPYYQFSESVSVRALVDYVTVEQAMQQAMGAWSLGYGAGVDVRLHDRAIMDLRATKLVGRNEDDTIKLSGFDVVLTLMWQF